MISLPLLRKNLLGGWKLALLILAILLMYMVIIIYMFDPDLAKTLDAYQQMMPGMMAAMGMNGNGGTLLEFIHTYLYGLIMPIVPMIFTLVYTNKLVMSYVDSGSMACLLATPNSRGKIIRTQMLSIILYLVVILSVSTITGYISCEWMFPGELLWKEYVWMNGSIFLLELALGGMMFFAACFFNDTKGYFMMGAGLPLLFYIIQMMANMGGDLEKLKYLTVFTLFPGEKILAGESVWVENVAMLGIGVVLYACGYIYFTKKDLYL